MKELVTAFLFLSVVGLHAQQLLHPVSPPLMVRAKYGNARNVFNIVAVPALMLDSCRFSAALYFEKKYMMEELKIAGFAAYKSFDNSGVLIILQQFGSRGYLEQVAGISYARRFKALALAVDFRYVLIKVSNFKIGSGLHVGISNVITITQDLKTVVSVFNPKFFRPKDSVVRLPSGVTFGIGWQCASSVYVGMETSKIVGQPLSITTAIQYSISARIVTAVSWSITSNQPCISFRWLMRRMAVEAGSSYHPALGASPYTLISYEQNTSE